MAVRLSTEEFIKKAVEVNKNRYDYSLTKYMGYRKNITLICPEHGKFVINAGNHLKGIGCRQCYIKTLKYSTEDFIKKASMVHNNKYDYSLVEYINSHSKVKIICPDHGIFNQKANSHLRGSGCSECGGSHSLNTKKFIKKAAIVHNNKYNYSLVKYKDAHSEIKIICPEHGIFKQIANSHIRGSGCIKCKKLHNYNTNEYIEIVKNIHGNKYNYSLVEYKNNRTKIKIICPEHGIFKQIPKDHLNGSKCPNCKETKGESRIRVFLEENNINYVYQKSFKKCKNIKQLPFDFFLPKYNLCIEYDGKQHFESIEYFGGVDSFEKRKHHDKIKTDFCILHNIKLLRISYKEYKKIEQILNRIFYNVQTSPIIHG